MGNRSARSVQNKASEVMNITLGKGKPIRMDMQNDFNTFLILNNESPSKCVQVATQWSTYSLILKKEHMLRKVKAQQTQEGVLGVVQFYDIL